MKPTKAFACLTVLLLILSGCNRPATPPSQPPQEPPTAAQPVAEPTPATPQPGQFVFTRENFPRLDGSTSTVPLAQAMMAVLLSTDVDQVEDLIHFSKTTQSYRRLMACEADLLLAAEPAQSIWDEKKALGFDWEMEPFAIDGLIFVVNAENPVQSLTVSQVQDIYTGKITNWSQVGGLDEPIIPFQRDEEAGSQTMMKKLVMDGLAMMEPPVEYRQDSMMGLMEAVKSYEDSAGAIGYSVYYYANDMRMAEGLKILSIEDAQPGAESFRDGSYPFTNPYYVLMRADWPEDSPVSVLFHWILSDEGQKLVAHAGYVAVSAAED